MLKEKKPLYRRVNTRAHGVRHRFGGDYRDSRAAKGKGGLDWSMHGGARRGLDYTPLFRFLLSRVGDDWATTFSEAVARLDTPEPIFWMVARSEMDRKPFVLLGENSYFSGLYVDDDNRLAVVDPSQTIETMKPSCACCTHTFNGSPFVQKYSAD